MMNYLKLGVCLLGMLCSLNVHAMGWFSKDMKLRQTELTPAELQQLHIQSGWSKEESDLMMFEVGNKLSGPIFCIGASFEFNDGKNAIKHLSPSCTYPPMPPAESA